jgi:peptide/nickel transport system permease protein
LNLRRSTLLIIAGTALMLLAILIIGLLIDEQSLVTQPQLRNQAPSPSHWFGTDWLGRDMFARTMKGLLLSIRVGLFGAVASTLLALTFGLLAATGGKRVDRFISWLIDLFLSVPHLVTLIMIAYISGGGLRGIVIGIALTHWPSLARVLRAEAMQIRQAEYVRISERFGKSRFWIARHHVLPHLLPQLMVGFLLLFPHAILHEAAITFLGLGLSPHQPAIGIILNESMRYLSTGMWWLAIFPGISLIIVVRLFGMLGERLGMLLDPRRAHE